MSIIVALAILAAAQDVAPTATDPLAPAASGKLQCYEPDVAKRSCQSLASYNKRPDGKYDNKATVMLSSSPLLVMETVTIVDIDAGAVCGALRKQDIDDAVVWINGSKLAEADAAATRNQIVTSMAPLLDRRICTTYVPDGAQLLAKVTINGAPLPALDEKVIWVAPTDGYKLAP
jgi:hypothetical protein